MLCCRLLETVPADDMSKAREILRVLNDAAAGAGAASGLLSDSTGVNPKLILPSTQ